jgi:hypothetical protein
MKLFNFINNLVSNLFIKAITTYLKENPDFLLNILKEKFTERLLCDLTNESIIIKLTDEELELKDSVIKTCYLNKLEKLLDKVDDEIDNKIETRIDDICDRRDMQRRVEDQLADAVESVVNDIDVDDKLIQESLDNKIEDGLNDIDIDEVIKKRLDEEINTRMPSNSEIVDMIEDKLPSKVDIDKRIDDLIKGEI